MKKIIKHSNQFVFALTLCMMIISGCSCSAPKSTPDPLAGFYPDSLYAPDSHKAITDDYKDYLKTLSPEEQKYAGPILFYKDGTGQHAVQIRIGLNGTSWENILIYDKNDKRIRTVKYSSGNYRS